MVNVHSLIHSDAWWWGKRTRVTVVATCGEVLVVVLVTYSAFSLAKFGISPLCLRETDFVWLHWWWRKCYYQSQRPCIMILQSGQHRCQWVRHHRRCFLCCRPVQHLPVWLTSQLAGCCLCCCSYMSLTMTYPSRVCLASSFLFSSRSSGTRRRSGGPQQPIVRAPHRQSLLPVRLRTPAPLNRNARWRSPLRSVLSQQRLLKDHSCRDETEFIL